MKVLFLTNIPSPYMVGYLNELGKKCNLTVVFEKDRDNTRPDSWNTLLNNINFEAIVLKGISVDRRLYGDKMESAPDDKALSFKVVKYINACYDFIIVGNPCTPTGIIEILYLRAKKIDYIIQSEGGFPGTGKGLKEKLKYFLMSKANGYFSTCDLDDEYFIQYGANKNEIMRYPFASISKVDLPLSYIDREQKNQYKKLLGITTPKMILTVGRSVYVKGFDVLLNSLQGLSKDEVSIYFVGGECKQEYRKIIKEKKIENVFFVDNISQSELKKYYCAADIFVLPTRSDTWGLVINEAMTYGLPVITTDKCVAGNALIENGKNGYIIESENDKQLNDSIKKLLADSKKRESFGKYNYSQMREWTFETMGEKIYMHLKNLERTK